MDMLGQQRAADGSRSMDRLPSVQYDLIFQSHHVMTESVRLAKRVAEMFECSRTEATQYIEGGWIKVDGSIVEEPGHRVSMQEQIELLPDAVPAPVEPVTLLLNKPPGTTIEDARQLLVDANRSADDRSGTRLLKRHLNDLSVMAPLEAGMQGLLVLTQDWRIIRKLSEDADKIEHEYIVDVTGEAIAGGLAQLNQPLSFNGKALPPMKVSWQNETRLRFAIKAPPAGLIQFLCKRIGLTPVAIKRIRLGRLPMAGLKMGQWRYLLGYERF